MFVSNWESIAGVILTRIDLKSSEKMSDLFSIAFQRVCCRSLVASLSTASSSWIDVGDCSSYSDFSGRGGRWTIRLFC